MRRQVLIVEDEVVTARAMQFELEALGAAVLGPAATVQQALELIEACNQIDAAVLDILLEGEMVYPVARRLHGRKVPFVFYTGVADAVMPIDLHDFPRITKPTSSATVALSIESLYRKACGGLRATGAALADIYLGRTGQYMVRIRDGQPTSSADALIWLGAGKINLSDWAVRLRLPLRPGVFYCVPKRYLGMLRQSIQIMG